jgi:competence protein ComEC
MAQTLGELSAVGIPVRTTGSGDSFALGETVIDVLWPARGATFRRDNDSSIVLVIRAETEKGEKRVVLCGDIEKEGLEGVSRVAPELKADIMEVPHHGSAKPTAYAFVDELDPAVALQSTGPRRMNDERWDDVKEGRVWLMTAQDGAVWAEIMRDGEVQGGKFRE